GRLRGFFGHELAEVGGRTGKHCSTKVGKPRLQLGIGKARVDLLVELVDDLGGRFLGRAESEMLRHGDINATRHCIALHKARHKLTSPGATPSIRPPSADWQLLALSSTARSSR